MIIMKPAASSRIVETAGIPPDSFLPVPSRDRRRPKITGGFVTVSCPLQLDS